MQNEINWFVRIGIGIFCLFLIILISFNYFYIDPKGEINSGILVLLSMLLILVLSESFDNFSLGKLITLTRETKEKEKKVEVLELRNSELLKQIISISSIQKQTQQHTNIYGDYHETVSDQRASIQEADTKLNKEEVEKLLTVVGDSLVISEKVSIINNELASKGLSIESDTAKVLIKYLAGTQLLLRFEQVHSIIFGSQIYLLKKLNESAGEGRDFDFVFGHIDHVKQRFQDTLGGWDYDQYLNYLYSNTLIIKGENSKLHITNLGVEYLTWIFRNGKSDNKPL